MFDRRRLEHFLESLQTETHFSNGEPKRIIVDMAPHSPLDDLMDKYDLFIQGNFNHNYGTTEFPVYGPQSSDNPFINPMYMPKGGWATYGAINFSTPYVTGIDVGESGAQVPPRETPYDRLKAKMTRLAAATSVEIVDPLPAPPLSPSPDYTHTITAWRGWIVDDDGNLGALGTTFEWEPRRAARARCKVASGSHYAPNLSCSCGFWSFKSRELLTEALSTYATDVDVIGEVEIWGRVIECENGWRSEFAYPKELWLLDEGLESLSWKYGVKVRRLA